LKPELGHVVAGLAATALSTLELEGLVPGSGELRERVQLCLEDQALVATQAMFGADTTLAQAAVDARFAGLEAAGLMLTAGAAQRALRGAIERAMGVAFTSLAAK